ncbi:MAG TPA: hypothetical protein VG122_07315 [Gemmata sp.]|jgi:hypothetical protein|nr:hypothetical protein [Gemmata sp.]
MPISWTCKCGKTLRVADEHAGKHVECPVCKTICVMQKEEPKHEVVPGGQADATPPTPVGPAATPEREVDGHEDDEEASSLGQGFEIVGEGRSKGKRHRHREEDDSAGRRRKRRRFDGEPRDSDLDLKDEEARKDFDHGLTLSNINFGIVIGITLMIGGVVLFLAGMQGGMFICPAVVLFVLGFLLLAKGLASG